MNIPQVNAGATNRNRDQTRRICELLGYGYTKDVPQKSNSRIYVTGATSSGPFFVRLSSGSFTLDQVVEMLGEFVDEDVVEFEEGFSEWRWVVKSPTDERGVQCVLGEYKSRDPHDLTAAMDALIKVLEEKP